MVTIWFSSSIEHDQSLGAFLVEDPVSTGAASYGVLGLDLDLLLTVGTEVLDALVPGFLFLCVSLVHIGMVEALRVFQ